MLLDSTKVGTATDTAGHFVLPLPQPKGILVFSFIGYKTQKVKYTDGKLVIVKMQPDVSGLDEVQVIAYGSQKKRTVISAISTLKADEMKELPTHSLESLLQGHMAGVEVNNLSGLPVAVVPSWLSGDITLFSRKGKEPMATPTLKVTTGHTEPRFT